ncbi:hypothetical protein JWZ98_12135 [Methylomonas sp. EFPC1]|nr:hypothetical protein JWZ98_12135 [Methylomonas sp. EFPC1]
MQAPIVVEVKDIVGHVADGLGVVGILATLVGVHDHARRWSALSNGNPEGRVNRFRRHVERAITEPTILREYKSNTTASLYPRA